MNDIEDIVPISKGQLRAFMYENYAKGKNDAAEAIIAAVKNNQKSIAGLAGIGNAVLVEEYLVELIERQK